MAFSSIGNGVLLELLEKKLRELRLFDEKRALRGIIFHEHGRVENALVHKAGSVALLDLETHPAAGDPLSLVLHRGHALAADRDIEPPQPCVQRFPQLDLAAVRLQCLALQVEDDKPGPGAVGHADTHGIAGQRWPETWLHDKRDMIGMNLPAGVIREPFVGQGALRPPAVEEADLAFFSA